MTEKLTLSFTRIKTFLQCRQKYVWIYEENLATPDKAYPLVLGDLVHQLLHEHLLGNWSIEDIQDINKVKGMMTWLKRHLTQANSLQDTLMNSRTIP